MLCAVVQQRVAGDSSKRARIEVACSPATLFVAKGADPCPRTPRGRAPEKMLHVGLHVRELSRIPQRKWHDSGSAAVRGEGADLHAPENTPQGSPKNGESPWPVPWPSTTGRSRLTPAPMGAPRNNQWGVVSRDPVRGEGPSSPLRVTILATPSPWGSTPSPARTIPIPTGTGRVPAPSRSEQGCRRRPPGPP